jgi:hypothetical protein
MKAKKISSEQQNELLNILKNRFDPNTIRHADIEWSEVQAKLENNPDALWSLFEMKVTAEDTVSEDLLTETDDDGQIALSLD